MHKNVTILLIVFGTLASALTSGKFKYTFDTVANPVTTVPDDNGKGHTGTVSTAGGFLYSFAPGWDGIGKAVRFPGVWTATGPKVCITSPDKADLNPSTSLWNFGCRIRVALANLTNDHGSNLVQKGLSNTAQWKLQLDPRSDGVLGYPSCVVRNATNPTVPVLTRSNISVADGVWHKVVCERTSAALRILIDGFEKGSQPLASTYVIDTTGSDLTIGAKSVGNNNDQYHGEMDEPYFNLIV